MNRRNQADRFLRQVLAHRRGMSENELTDEAAHQAAVKQSRLAVLRACKRTGSWFPSDGD